jgi:HEAT repeat protein
MTRRAAAVLFLIVGAVAFGGVRAAGLAAVSVQGAPQPVQGAPPTVQGAAQTVSPADVAAAVDKLGSLDLAVRTSASRTIRRGAAAVVVPALTRAAREHADGYTRYRALVLLAGFDDPSTGALMRQLMSDRNDRLRMVSYQWNEHHPDAAAIPSMIEALGNEQSEFVRPALLRALAANGRDDRAHRALLPLITRGQDDFRGAVIEALGEYKATYGLGPISEVAKLDGPLQDDAVTALGRIGDPSSHELLAELQRTAPRVVQPSIAAALCLIGANVSANDTYLKQSLTFAASSENNQALLRGAAHALAVLAARGNAGALTALLDVGVPGKDPIRTPVALAIGGVALRNSDALLAGLESRNDRDAALDLMQDAFDRLSSEDFQLELFYVAVRRAYWRETSNTPRRQLIEALIRKLEF